MNSIRPVFSILLFLLCATAFASSVTDIKAKISADGASVVYKNAMHSGEFKKILSGVRSGDKNWLDIGAALRTVSDAHGSEELDTAFSNALSKSAGTALNYINKPFRARDVCKPSMIEPEKEELTRFFARMERALNTVKDSALADRKALCTYYLASSKRMIEGVEILASHDVSPEKIAEQIKSSGVARVAARLKDLGLWESVVARIAAGNPEGWIGVAMSLRAEPSARHQIDLALATAISTNPLAVLKTVPDEVTQADICSVNTYEIAPDIKKDIVETVADTLTPLKTYTAVSAKVQACLSGLQK